MPAPVVHVGACGVCPHGGQLSFIASSARVLLGGQPALTLADMASVAGCPFQVPVPGGSKPQPCISARWLAGATRVLINGQPAVLQVSNGMCQSAEQIAQGPPSVTTLQTRVLAT